MKQWIRFLLVTFLTLGVVPAASAQSEPTALLRFVHALPTADPVDIYLNGEKIVDDLDPAAVTDYRLAPADSNDVAIRASDADADADPLLTQAVDLEPDAAYTLAIAGDTDEPEAFLLEDDLSSQNDGTLRVVNLLPGDDPIAATLEEAAITELLPYGESSDPIAIDQPSGTVAIFNPDGDPLATTPDLTFSEGQQYTLFVLPAEDEPAQVLVASYTPTDEEDEAPEYELWVPLITQGAGTDANATPIPLVTISSDAASTMTSQLDGIGGAILDQLQGTATPSASEVITATGGITPTQTPIPTSTTIPTAPATPTEAAPTETALPTAGASESITQTDTITQTQPTSPTQPLLPITGESGAGDLTIPLWLVIDGALLIVLVFLLRFWWELRTQ